MKKYTNKILIAIIFGFILLLISLLIINNRTHPNNKSLGSSITTLDLSRIKSIQLSGSEILQVKQGSIESQTKLPATAYIENDTLYLNDGENDQIIKLRLPHLNEINVSGAAKVTVENFNQQDIKLGSSGAAQFLIQNTNLTNVTLYSSGDSKLIFNNCHLKHLTVNVTGAAEIIVNSFEDGTLSGLVAGDASIKYSGNLIKNDLKTLGQDKVIHIND